MSENFKVLYQIRCLPYVRFTILSHMPPAVLVTKLFVSYFRGTDVLLDTSKLFLDSSDTRPTLVCSSANLIPVDHLASH
jgi:hypothetical protein